MIVTVSQVAAATGEESIYLSPGERISVRDLVEAALIQSATATGASSGSWR